ncbi:hypothetical protein AOL_s00193g121 [Orbilia oligospora ATCC 24927]|uniref:Uncharacterized protein n=1 Tax=Arthrobotrys oligospora (strain ATCC 24927 / CBS 115.81 / DSM 1491) TaxID=756982 RepID=G1XRC2_ARTOA|nr:hypothetical protein AOL_s00193g121 [Orbilia oligospora ATCC 24927]EGX44393.1 hypothetical protein AOL_s00193g121 [Orbilia oligospora ATCC 24927]
MAATAITIDPLLDTLGPQDGVEIVTKQSPTPQAREKDNVPSRTLLAEQADIKRTVGKIVLLYVLGFAIAVSHHCFNLNLDGRAPLSQSFTLQVGLVFAFLVRAFVAGATASIVPPSTLVIEPGVYETTSLCEVSSLNFGALPEYGSQRLGRLADDYYSADSRKGAYSADPSTILRKLGTNVAVGGRILGMPSQCSTNCSYTVNFNGPALKCTDEDWKSQDAPWDPLEIFRFSHHYNSSVSSNGDLWTVYANPKKEERRYSESGVPLRPYLYIEAPERKEYYIKCFKCSLYNATYNVDIDFTNGVETVTYELSKVAKFIPIIPDLESSLPNYEQLAYFAYNRYFTGNEGPFVGEIFEYGGISMRGVRFNTDIIFTNLVTPWITLSQDFRNSTQNFPMDNLREGFEELSHNLTISLLSRSDLIVSSKIMTTCTSLSYRNVYRYRSTQLYVSYGPLMVFSMVVIVLGLRATLKNGDICQWGFSQIMLTTRNPSLDEMGKGSCFGVVHSGSDLQKHRLKFGELRCNVESTIRHAAFGLEDEVVDLSAERMYA